MPAIAPPLRPVGFQSLDPIRIWAVSDGRAGIANQALGLAEAVAARTPATIEVKTTRLRPPWSALPPGLIPAPRQALSVDSDPFEPPWPDVVIACGRHSLPFSMGVRRWSEGRTFVVQLQDPRVDVHAFDLVIPPAHDGLEGSNVFAIVGACHRITPERVAAEAKAAPFDLARLPRPRIAALIGGKSKRQDISPARARMIAKELVNLKASVGGALLVTLSRRTSKAARRAFDHDLRPHAELYFGGEGANPYFAILDAADALIVTADSANMAVEAAGTGKPVMIVPVDGKLGKLGLLHLSLLERGCVRPFAGRLEAYTYEPLAETDRAARRVIEVLAARGRVTGARAGAN